MEFLNEFRGNMRKCLSKNGDFQYIEREKIGPVECDGVCPSKSSNKPGQLQNLNWSLVNPKIDLGALIDQEENHLH